MGDGKFFQHVSVAVATPPGGVSTMSSTSRNDDAPYSYIYKPIHRNFEDPLDIMGIVIAAFTWESFFQNLLPVEVVYSNDF